MKQRWESLRFLVPALLLLLVGASGWVMGSWAWLSGSDYRPDFNDLRQVTATATCIQANPAWDITGPTCDPSGRAYNYPSLWARVFAAAGLGEPSTIAIGACLALLLLVTITALAYAIRDCLTGGIRLALFTIASLTPPIWLAVDRGSTDIIILSILGAAALLGISGRLAAACVAVAVAVLLKLFAIGAAVAIVVDPRRSRWHLALLVGLLGLAGVILVGELALISSRTPRTDHLSFGVSTIPIRFQSYLGPFVGNGRVIGLIAMGLFALGLLAAWLLLRTRFLRPGFNTLVDAAVDSRRAWVLLLIGLGTTLVAYLVGTSYDYRLIFLLLVVAALLTTWQAAPRPSAVAAGATVAVMAMSGPWLMLGAFSDVLLLLLAPAGGILLMQIALKLHVQRERNPPAQSVTA